MGSDWWDEAAPPGVPEPGDKAFIPYDLGKLISDGIPPPRLLPGDLLYAGGLHIVSGEPDSGKTTFCLWQMLGALRLHRPVLMLDEEGGPEMTAEKLIALGATERDVEQLHYVPFPAKTWTPRDIFDLRTMVAEIRPVLIVLDSCAAFMARAGLDENAAADVTTWWAQVLTPLAREHGAAVVVIDHDGKNMGGSRFSRGSGAKLAASDVMVKVELVEPFSRTQNGVLRLNLTKDRRGWLHRFWDVQVRTSDGISLILTEAEEAAPAEPGGLSPAEQKLLKVLSADPATPRELVDRVAAEFGHGLNRATVSTSLNHLAQAKLADRMDQGPGRAALWSISAT